MVRATGEGGSIEKWCSVLLVTSLDGCSKFKQQLHHLETVVFDGKVQRRYSLIQGAIHHF